MVFFNRILRCFVLFDLKIGELKHQNIGQMQMYVNYYDRKHEVYNLVKMFPDHGVVHGKVVVLHIVLNDFLGDFVWVILSHSFPFRRRSRFVLLQR